MRRLCLTLALLIGGVLSIHAQAATTATSKLVTDQAAPDLATAQAYVFRYYPDGATTGIVLPMVCAGASSPFVCTAAFPAFTPGAHTITATASNAAGESAKSSPLSFTFVVIPATPTNLRIQ